MKRAERMNFLSAIYLMGRAVQSIILKVFWDAELRIAR
jgi:hypothetical protein